ncbi:LCP family protein [Corynebacterium alimapuense]|uniref:LytR family transcriptional regulator n=1 Tax=Corynebacterium alimapuense TaxID=1576874 RepID=A0A3M8KA21_9CORY|nr:LCP family protein [Corynebacterium alimapuense]RNE50010.1 LytR family transcriptional regulator [Corynebacterium alimapuense]
MDERDRRNDRQQPLPGRSSDPRDSEDIIRGHDGRPLTDRYGRPVRRRPATPPSAQSQRRPRRTAEPPAGRPSPPRQYVPPRQPDYQQRQYQPNQYQQPQYQQQYQQLPPQPPQQGGRHTQSKPPRRRFGGGCLRPLGWAAAIFLVFTMVLTLWADAQLNRVEATPDNQVSNTSGTNWLLVGSDSREGLSDEEAALLGTGGDIGVGRTDTIMLLHLSALGQARLVSIPRDSLVSIPGYGENKVNAAFTFGGPVLLAETVEQATGLRIDHYAEIGMGGLANVVDAVGGVELCPEYAINDPLAQLDVEAGCQEMDGPTALGYVRTRATPLGDLDRVERQREFFSSLVETATSPGTLLNPLRLIPLITNTASSFTVGDGDHVWHLARVALAMRSGVETETVPVAGFADYDVGNVVLWDDAGATALWESMK